MECIHMVCSFIKKPTLKKYYIWLLWQTVYLMPTPLPQRIEETDLSMFPEPTYFRSLAGKLEYLTITMSDIQYQYTVNFVCWHMHFPMVTDFGLLKRILRYLKSTLKNIGNIVMCLVYTNRKCKCYLESSYQIAIQAISLIDKTDPTIYIYIYKVKTLQR